MIEQLGGMCLVVLVFSGVLLVMGVWEWLAYRKRPNGHIGW
jgi:hypothetical protein